MCAVLDERRRTLLLRSGGDYEILEVSLILLVWTFSPFHVLLRFLAPVALPSHRLPTLDAEPARDKIRNTAEMIATNF